MVKYNSASFSNWIGKLFLLSCWLSLSPWSRKWLLERGKGGKGLFYFKSSKLNQVLYWSITGSKLLA